MARGRIILLHGPSSSGKTTLARAVQDQMDTPFWHLSIDHLLDAEVLPMRRFRSGEFDWTRQRPAFLGGFHRAVAGFATAGNDLVVEHIFDDHVDVAQLRGLLLANDVFFVGLHCPLEILERREDQRADRRPGSAAADHAAVHAGRIYDCEIDSAQPAAANAAILIHAWHKRGPRSAFFDTSH